MSYRKIRRIATFAANNITATFDTDWDVDKYRDEHESEEHWQLRKSFMEKWKKDFPEERLICLARVFTNVELMGCRYPPRVMQEITQLSYEVALRYREQKKTRLQRTFVSASVAAEDRAKGIKRQGGEIVEDEPKSSKISFVPQGQVPDKQQLDSKSDESNDGCDTESNERTSQAQSGEPKDTNNVEDTSTSSKKVIELQRTDEYINENKNIQCLDVREFKEYMFQSTYGRLVLLVRPWATKLWNIQTSCQVCGLNLTYGYENGLYTLCINGKMLVQTQGDSKVEAKIMAENLVWEKLRKEVISVYIKEQWIAQGDACISVSDVSGKKKNHEFGTPVENSVAMKMMKMMGWKGGGLGVDAQGIAEPIKPNLQMVNRAGLGSASGIRMLRRTAQDLMQRYIASEAFDLDLVFSSEFSKDERAILHQCAQKIGLASRSYGEGEDRFLVVKKKLDPFSLARAVIEKGGTTPKYEVFIPAVLARRT